MCSKVEEFYQKPNEKPQVIGAKCQNHEICSIYKGSYVFLINNDPLSSSHL